MPVHCFIWLPALHLWSGRRAGRQTGRQVNENLSFSDFVFEILYLDACKSFLVFSLKLDGLIFSKGDFRRIRCLLDDNYL